MNINYYVKEYKPKCIYSFVYTYSIYITMASLSERYNHSAKFTKINNEEYVKDTEREAEEYLKVKNLY